MKTTSLRQVIVALTIAVTAATVHGAWFASADATTEGAPVASIRIAEWDHYEQKWVAAVIGAGETLRDSEGAIFELRSLGGGDVSLSYVPAGLTIDTLSAQDLEALDIPLPSESNMVPFAPLPTVPAATGAPTYIRLAVSGLSGSGIQTRPSQSEVWPGPLTPTDADRAALDVNGSVGVHSGVALSDGGDTVTFNWDIGRWAKGDLFIGMNQYTYRVLDRTGEFKRFVASADIEHPDAGLEYNITAGCAANWQTGEVYATNFADFDPAINVITRHPSGTGRSLYSPENRRIATTTLYDDARAEMPVDINPESVVFDADMNMYVGHSDSFLGPMPRGVFRTVNRAHPFLYDAEDDWHFLDINGVPLTYSDGDSFPVVVDETGGVMELGLGGVAPFSTRRNGIDTSTRLKYNGNNLIFSPATSIASLGVPALLPETYLADPATGQALAEAGGAQIPGRWPMGRRIHRYNVQPDGSYRGANTTDPAGPDRDLFWAATSRFGTDWIDLNATGDVVYYTSEDSLIHRYRVRPGINNAPVGQLPDVGFGPLLPGDIRFNALRILPPGDGSGGFLTAGHQAIYRFAQNGAFVQKYQVGNDAYLKSKYPTGSWEWQNAGLVTAWYAMEIDPNGKTFWASSNDSGWIYQFDIASGRELNRVEAVEYLDVDVDPLEPEGRVVGSLCMMWEYTAPQEICFAPGGGPDGVDNDGDGLVDENCKVIEICNNEVDDDGDRLLDHSDPDCGAEEPPVGQPDVYVTDQNTDLAVPSVGTLVVLNNDTDPDGDALLVAGYGEATPDLAPGELLTTQFGTVRLQPDGSFLYDPAPAFHGQFTFVYTVTNGASTSAPTTVTINVRPFVADDSYTAYMNTPLTGNNVLANDSIAPMLVSAAGPDTITSLTGSSTTFQTVNGGTVNLNRNGTFVYTSAPGFLGVDSFVYLGYDGNSDSPTTARVSITVIPWVNSPPVAVDDSRTTSGSTPVSVTVLDNDTDPDGHPLSVVATGFTQPANGTVTLTGNTFTFIATAGFTGTTTFTYTISDGNGGTAMATVTVLVTAANCTSTGYLTYSQGGWGSTPSGSNPGAFLAANFSRVYPGVGGSVQIGGTRKLTFTSASAIEAFLPQGGPSKVLTSNATNPTSSSGGNFAAQLLAMQLAADFSRAGVTKVGMGSLVMRSGPLTGMTLDSVLAMANTVIGGTTSALPSGMSMSTLAGILESLNMNFHEGTANQGLLGCSGGGGVQPVVLTGRSDAYSIARNKTLTVSASNGVLVNDTANGGSVVLVSGPSKGTLTLNSDGSFTYRASSSTGTVTFTYKIVAPGQESPAVSVSISVKSR